jgi:hypothetical protein
MSGSYYKTYQLSWGSSASKSSVKREVYKSKYQQPEILFSGYDVIFLENNGHGSYNLTVFSEKKSALNIFGSNLKKKLFIKFQLGADEYVDEPKMAYKDGTLYFLLN